MGFVYISLTGIIAILCLLFGIRVYLADRDNKVNKSFGLFTGVTAVWILLDFLAYQISLADYQLIINRILFGVICFMIFVLAWFVDIFPRPLIKLPNFIKYLAFLVASLVALLSLLSNIILEDVTIESWGSNLVLGDYFLIFAIYASIFAMYPLAILVIKTIKFRGDERNQIKYILYGIASLAILNLLFNMFIPLLTKNFEFGRFGTYSAIFFVGFTTYAILKARLFNLRIILTETVVGHDYGVFDVAWVCQPKNFPKILKKVLEELENFKNGKISSSEIQRFRDILNKGNEMDFDDPYDTLGWLLEDLGYEKKIVLPGEIVKMRNKITTAKIQEIAKQIFDLKKINVVAIGPVKNIKFDWQKFPK